MKLNAPRKQNVHAVIMFVLILMQTSLTNVSRYSQLYVLAYVALQEKMRTPVERGWGAGGVHRKIPPLT